MSLHPGFKGKIVLYGHSLGSLLSFDILCNQTFHKKPNENVGELDLTDMLSFLWKSDDKETIALCDDPPALLFKVDKFFGIFLVLIVNHQIIE